MTRKIRIGINGFGRIGRCVARLALDSDDLEIAAVNDLVDHIDNLIYLYNYDSVHGRAPHRATVAKDFRGAVIGAHSIPFFNAANVAEAPWRDLGVDVLVDASGVTANVEGARKLVEDERVAKTIITHSPDAGVDRYVIMGVNDDGYDPSRHHVISATICDANAIAHVVHFLEETWGIESGSVTTLHPWLSYQNLVDGAVAWQALPGHYWTDFSLGRSSIGALIPKNTTAVTALRTVLPESEPKLRGLSFRIPTHVVCVADLTIRIRSQITLDQLERALLSRFADSPYVTLTREPLVSVDFEHQSQSAIVDMRWLNVIGGDTAKFILWYDNEWGYSSRVVDLVRLVHRSA